MAVRVRSRVAGVLRFLISMPLSRQVKRAGRIVSVLAMVTIVPASLVVASADLGQAIDKKRPELEALAAALTLEVGLSRETAREDRPDSSKGKDQPKTEGKEDEGDQGEWCDAGGAILPAEACVAAAEFGEAFEAAWGATLLEQSGARVRATAEGIGDARRAWARRQVLLESVARRTGTVNVAEATSRATGRRAWARGVLDAELKARTGSGPVTSFGKRAGKIFGGLARRVSGPVAMEVTDRPLTLRELASTAVAAGVGLSVDSAALGGTEPTLLDKLLSETAKETLGKLAEEKVKRPEDVEWLRRTAKLAAMAAASRVRDTKRAAGDPMRIDGEAMRMVEVFVNRDLARSYKRMIDQVTRLEFPKRTGDTVPVSVSFEAVSRTHVDWGKVEKALHQYRADTGGGGPP